MATPSKKTKDQLNLEAVHHNAQLDHPNDKHKVALIVLWWWVENVSQETIGSGETYFYVRNVVRGALP